jgi:hypothetical protein
VEENRLIEADAESSLTSVKSRTLIKKFFQYAALLASFLEDADSHSLSLF